MQRSTLMSRFLSSWEPSVLPPRGPQGMVPAGSPPDRAHLPVIDPPTLCEAGPCRHYHRVVSVMDAQAPVGKDSNNDHAQTSRVCYPTAGIEVELGETPVLQCSKWEPESEPERDERRRKFLTGNAGKQFRREVETYEAALAPEDEEPPMVVAPTLGVVGSLASTAPSDATLDELAAEAPGGITTDDAQALKGIADELGIDIDDEGNEVLA